MPLNSIEKLAKHIAKLPGIGEKTAFRLAMFMFYSNEEYLKSFSDSLLNLRDGIQLCEKCFNLSENELCEICSNERRDHKTLCVVEDYVDLLAIEKTEEYFGAYHVLHGLIAPIKGISVSDIKAEELIERVKKDGIKEVIFAFDAGLDADTTANYFKRRLTPTKVKLSRIAYGISLGSDIENADARSLSRSILDRSNFTEDEII